MLEVVAAMICEGERFLICQRPEGKNCAGAWEFPGGKIEAGESGAQALVRECREELAVELEPGGVLADVVHDYPGFSIHLTLYRARVLRGAPAALEHSAVKWICEAELADYEFCPADRKLLGKLGLCSN